MSSILTTLLSIITCPLLLTPPTQVLPTPYLALLFLFSIHNIIQLTYLLFSLSTLCLLLECVSLSVCALSFFFTDTSQYRKVYLAGIL